MNNSLDILINYFLLKFFGILRTCYPFSMSFCIIVLFHKGNDLCEFLCLQSFFLIWIIAFLSFLLFLYLLYLDLLLINIIMVWLLSSSTSSSSTRPTCSTLPSVKWKVSSPPSPTFSNTFILISSRLRSRLHVPV